MQLVQCSVVNNIGPTPNPNRNPNQPYSKSPEVLMELTSVSSFCRSVLKHLSGIRPILAHNHRRSECQSEPCPYYHLLGLLPTEAHGECGDGN
jgi:hypothetical protein